jgi:hypothetical protein
LLRYWRTSIGSHKSSDRHHGLVGAVSDSGWEKGRATHTLITSNFTDGLTVAPGHHVAVLAGNQPTASAGYLTVLDLDRHSTRPTPLFGPPTNYVLVDFSRAGELAMASAIDPGPLKVAFTDTTGATYEGSVDIKFA